MSSFCLINLIILVILICFIHSSNYVLKNAFCGQDSLARKMLDKNLIPAKLSNNKNRGVKKGR